MIHFYFGENDFAIQSQVTEIKKRFIAKYGAENVLNLDGGEVNPQHFISEIVNINLFAPYRLIIVKFLATNKMAWQALGENIERLPDSTELIIIEKKPDKRTKTFSALKKTADFKEFPALKPFELPDFVMNEAEKQGLVLKHDAVQELILACGSDQWRIANEIKKLHALNKVIDAKKVRHYVEADISANAFKLLEDALNSRHDVALAELYKLRQNEDPHKFFGLIASQVFTLAAVYYAGKHNIKEVASDMGVHPFVAEKMLRVARNINKDKLSEISHIVANTDQKIKSTGINPWTLIEIAIAKISQI